jgi:hypothetical protein
MFVDRSQRTEIKTGSDLFIGRRVTVPRREAGEKVENFFLPPRNGHAQSLANKRRMSSEVAGEGVNRKDAKGM